MKKIIITEKQFKNLMESKKYSQLNVFKDDNKKIEHSIIEDFDDWDAEVVDFGSRDGVIQISLIKYIEQEDKEDVTIFEIEFDWESEPGDSSVGYSGGFGWGATKFRKVEPEQEDLDIDYADIFIRDIIMGKYIDDLIYEAFNDYARSSRY